MPGIDKGLHHGERPPDTRSRDGVSWPTDGDAKAEGNKCTGYSGGAPMPSPQASKEKKASPEAYKS